jgi:hypothetical protein
LNGEQLQLKINRFVLIFWFFISLSRTWLNQSKQKLSKFDPFLFHFKNEATSIGDYFLQFIACLVTFVQPSELNSFDGTTKRSILML